MRSRFFYGSVLALGCTLGVQLGGVPSARADEMCRPCPFDCRGIGAASKDCSDRGMRNGQCCVDLDGRGMDQLRRKDQENAGRSAYRTDAGAYDDRNGYQPGDCPPGFHVNDRPCTPDERQRGCNDMRSPSGQTCVGWNQRRR